MPTINEYSQLWIPRAPRLFVVGARVEMEELSEIGFEDIDETIGRDTHGNFLLSVDKYPEAVKFTWKRVSGTIHAHPKEA